MTRMIITVVGAYLLTLILGRVLLPVLRALKAGQSIRDVGPTWHNYKSGTPMMGGLFFIISAVICLLCNIGFMKDYSVFYTLLLTLCFGAVGFMDDFFKMKKKQNMGLSSLQKALLQMAVSALYLYIMYRQGAMNCDLYIPFVNVTVPVHPLVYIFFAMFVMVGCDNAVNLNDGVDGLCASVTLPVMVFFAVVAFLSGKVELALLPAALVGGLLAYLVYNFHPAQVFMGDTGSLFLGGVVCALAFALDMPLILILVGFVYIVETLSVILQVGYFKLTHGKRIFKMAPIHHHYEMCGWSEEKIVFVFAGVSALMCVIAWFGVSGRIG